MTHQNNDWRGNPRKLLHFSAYWNPTVEFDPRAPKGMKLWATVLANCGESDRYALYGKVSVHPDKLGIDRGDIPDINAQIQDQNRNGGETHIYLFNTACIEKHPYISSSLHVGLVDEVMDETEVSRFPTDRIPSEFYDSVTRNGYSVPIWFKIKDLREIRLSEFENLRAYYPKEYYPKDLGWKQFNDKNDLSPLVVQEESARIWFGKDDLPERYKAWYELVLLSSVSGKREPLEPGLFRNPAIRDVYAKALKYMRYGDPILILGETGTGKTVLASFIRHNYLRLIKKKAVEQIITSDWPKIACGEFLNRDLLKSELFGWKKGAHSEAKTDQHGLLKQADGDCILFDEIHDLDRQVQRLLIKAVEEKKFRPLSALNDEDSDFLLLAASNHTVPELEARLDADFFYRIKAAILTLPPLRELKEDMPRLWQFEYEKAKSKITGGGEPRTPLNPTEEKTVVEILKREELPGNYRDLTRVAMRLVELLDDPKSHFSPQQAVREALGGRIDRTALFSEKKMPPIRPVLERNESRSVAAESMKKASSGPCDTSRVILEAFLEGKSLTEVLPEGTIVDVEGVLTDIQRYLSEQCRDLKKARRLTWPEVCGRFDIRKFKKWDQGACTKTAETSAKNDD